MKIQAHVICNSALLLSLSTVAFMCRPVMSLQSAFAAGKPGQKLYQGGVTQNEMIDNLERLGVKCMVEEGADTKLVVRDVRLGSNAYYKGLATGDVVKSLVKAGDLFQLTINRGDKTYMLSLKALSGEATDSKPLNASAKQTILNGKADSADFNLKAGQAKLASISEPVVDIGPRKVPIVDVNGKKPPIVDIDQKTPEAKLVRYDIELIIDITGSMNYYDGTGDLTKFEWCHEQVKALAQKLAPYKKTLTITTFNAGFETKANCDPAQVEQIYATVKPEGFTDLVDPLMNRCEAALTREQATKRPQLIAIISDGLPNIPKDPKEVNRQLIEFSQKLSRPGQLTITFLQIGDTFDGEGFCLDLDENLANEGAKYDLVNTKTFKQLKQIGMINSLVDAIKENAEYTTPGQRHYNRFIQSMPNAKNDIRAESNLRDKKDERKELEKQLLGR